MRPARILAVVLALLAAGALARPAEALNACTAADITSQNAADCPANSNPCTISKDFTIGNNCTLDFGTRSVTLKGGTIMTIGTGTVTLKAGTFTILGGGEINGRGESAAPNDRGGFMNILTTGAVNIQRASQFGRIDVSGITASGAVRIIAGGSFTMAGKIIGNSLSPNSGAGTVIIDAGGDIITQAGSILQATASGGISATLDLRATGRIDLGDVVDINGADGGTMSLDAGSDVIVRGLLADGVGDTGSGGELDVIAGTEVQILSSVFLRGTSSTDQMSGGCGGTVDIEARFGTLTISGSILADGASPDGSGGSITLTSAGPIQMNASHTIAARGGGAQSCGGEIDITGSRSVTSAATLDVSAGSGGGTIDILAIGAMTVTGQMLASASTTAGFGGDIRLDAGEGSTGALTVSSLLNANGGDCDSFGFCGVGGFIDLFGCDVNVQSTASLQVRGGVGGTNSLTAREQLTVNGAANATKTLGPGTDGTNRFDHTSRKPPVIASGGVVPSPIVTPRTTCSAFNVPAGCLPPCPVCGNGLPEYPETCDTLGTPVSCDGCSIFCQVENCNDGSVCTTDTCDPQLGCRHAPVANGTSCSDGLVCNGVESCLSGFCFASPPNCNDSIACTIDSCVEPTGCQHVNAPVGTTCTDSNACTVGDNCNGLGTCQSGSPAVCNDNRECTNDSCNPSTGCVFTNRTGSCTNDGNSCTNDICSGPNCVHPVLANGTACADSAFCTINDTCQSGVCLGGGARDCSDPNACTNDSCNETIDMCEHTPVGVGGSCSDGNSCTVGDACDAGGTCQPGAPTNCDDGNDCTVDSCTPGVGCQHTPRTGACTDDGNTCTNDTCSAGVCTHPALGNGAACSDGAFCTFPDACQSGSCVPGPARDCGDANSCTTDTCNEGIDLCVNTPVAAGSPCTDGNACTTGDSCAGTTCQAGPPTNCDDSNECTSDGCNTSTGCTHGNLTTACTSDGNTCTTDVCAGGACTHPAVSNGTACSDGAFCTVSDTCQSGSCAPGPARNCGDGNACTADSCNEGSDACENPPTAGLPCSDGNACSVGDTCNAGGGCQSGGPANCDDSNECTSDGCNTGSGCTHGNLSGPCTDDGNTCTGDTCVGGACTHPAVSNGTTCEDGAFCTAGDACQGGTCVPGPAQVCDDGDACTTDSCDESGDECLYAPMSPCCGDTVVQAPEECDDGNTDDTDACRNDCRDAMCGDGVVQTGVELCDQGAANSNAPDAACRTDCMPRRCGDGILDSGAGEECDDGNGVAGDGCSPTCFYDMPATAERIPGKPTSLTECIVEWAIDRPTLDKNGRPAFKQICQNGDPTCDFGSDPESCLFRVWLCANNHDVRLPSCNPGPGGAGTAAVNDVIKPSAKSLVRHPEDAPLRDTLIQAADAVETSDFDQCGPRIEVRVVRKSPIRKGAKAIGVKSTSTGSQVDADTLKLICLP